MKEANNVRFHGSLADFFQYFSTFGMKIKNAEKCRYDAEGILWFKRGCPDGLQLKGNGYNK